MALKLYNTLTRKKEEFKPVRKGFAGIYTCGPTVYDYAHIGNFRAYICGDILKRYMKYAGYKVKHVMNITDVDDKTIKGAMQEKISLKEYTKRYEKAFFEDLGTLNIDKADIFPRATEHITEMVGVIKKLLDKKIAYKARDGIYFAVSKFRDYGKLSHTKLEGLESGKRIKSDQYEKEEAQDFALWKFWTKEDGDVFWETEICKGRPGWHIECSTMSVKYLGQPFDIHGGGVDLIFPHHENEIAQAEGATNKKFVNYWFHNEHLLVNGKKMSKSLGNFFTLRDLLDKGYNPKAIRYLLISTHYRQQLNFTERGIKAAEETLNRLCDFTGRITRISKSDFTSKESKNHEKRIKKYIENTKENFDMEMNDDLNISSALGFLFKFVKEINSFLYEEKINYGSARHILDFIKKINMILGVLDFKEEKIPDEIKKLVEEREKARKEKDFKNADKIREEIRKKGYMLEDTGEGPRVKKIS